MPVCIFHRCKHVRHPLNTYMLEILQTIFCTLRNHISGKISNQSRLLNFCIYFTSLHLVYFCVVHMYVCILCSHDMHRKLIFPLIPFIPLGFPSVPRVINEHKLQKLIESIDDSKTNDISVSLVNIFIHFCVVSFNIEFCNSMYNYFFFILDRDLIIEYEIVTT